MDIIQPILKTAVHRSIDEAAVWLNSHHFKKENNLFLRGGNRS